LLPELPKLAYDAVIHIHTELADGKAPFGEGAKVMYPHSAG